MADESNNILEPRDITLGGLSGDLSEAPCPSSSDDEEGESSLEMQKVIDREEKSNLRLS